MKFPTTSLPSPAFAAVCAPKPARCHCCPSSYFGTPRPTITSASKPTICSTALNVVPAPMCAPAIFPWCNITVTAKVKFKKPAPKRLGQTMPASALNSISSAWNRPRKDKEAKRAARREAAEKAKANRAAASA